MTRYMLVVLASLVFNAGCTAPVWNRAGATQQDFNRESYECERDARQSGYFGGGIMGALNMRDFYDRCMVARGWWKSSAGPRETSPSPTAPSCTSNMVRLGTECFPRPTASWGITFDTANPTATPFRVSGVIRDSPADRDGVKQGDVIRSLDGSPIANALEAARIFLPKKPGDRITAVIERDGQNITVTSTMVPR